MGQSVSCSFHLRVIYQAYSDYSTCTFVISRADDKWEELLSYLLTLILLQALFFNKINEASNSMYLRLNHCKILFIHLNIIFFFWIAKSVVLIIQCQPVVAVQFSNSCGFLFFKFANVPFYKINSNFVFYI